MKTTASNKVKLGIFVSASVIFFTISIYYVGKRQQLFSTTFHINGIFQDISGIQVGNNVRFSGINIGIVEDIQQITDSTVQVGLQLEESSQKFIKTNATAVIGSDGLMGSKIVLIIPGKTGEDPISNNDFIETNPSINMDDIFLSLKITTDNAAIITNDLALILGSMREGKGTIGMLLMDTVFSKDLGQALINIKQGAGGFKQNMDAAGHNFLLRGYLKKKRAAKESKEESKNKTDK